MNVDDLATAAVLGATWAVTSRVLPGTHPPGPDARRAFQAGGEMVFTAIADAVEEDPDAAVDVLRSDASMIEVLLDLGEIAGYDVEVDVGE